MRFKRARVRYADTPTPITPFQAAQQSWDDRLGAARVQAYHWRLMAFGALALACVMTGGLLWQSTRSIVQPYVVEVDTQGAVRAVGPATEAYRPTDVQIGYHLAEFIKRVRSISIDPIVVRQNWLDAYNYVTPRGAASLNEFARNANPFGRVGRESITTEIASVVRASDSSFQVRWTERIYTNGTPTATERWTAILSIALQPPRDEERVHTNPLGIYIDGLDWSRELDTAKGTGEPR